MNDNFDDFDFDDDLFGDDDFSSEVNSFDDLRSDEDDLFADDDFGDDDFGDDELSSDSDFDFDDEDNAFNFDDNLSDAETEGGRNNFLIIAGVLIVFIVIGLVGILLVAGNQGPSEFDVTRTAIAEANATAFAQATETAVQSEAFAAETATATVVLEITAQAAATETAEIDNAGTGDDGSGTGDDGSGTGDDGSGTGDDGSGTGDDGSGTGDDGSGTGDDGSGTGDDGSGTGDDGGAIGVGAAFTQTAEAIMGATLIVEATQQAVLTEEAAGDNSGIADVLQTATALAATLNPMTPTPLVDGATNVGGGGDDGGVSIFPTTPPTVLPDTGLFDDITGSGGFGAIFLVVIGLIGVIFASRRMRQ